MSTELVKVDYAVYGLEENRATEIAKAFSEPFRELGELEDEFDQFRDFVGEYTPEVCAEAKNLSKRYVKIRTTTAAIHKSEKAVFLNAGRYVDALKNGQLAIGKEREEKLSEVADYFINIEIERKKILQAQRASILSKYMDIEVIPQNLGEMDDAVWEMFSTGAEQKYKKRIREEKKAEKERLAAENAEKVENERIRLENEKLKKEKDQKLLKQKELRKNNTFEAIEFLRDLEFITHEGGLIHPEYNYFIGSYHYSELDTEKELILFKTTTLNSLETSRIKAESDKKLKEEREAREKLEREAREKEEEEQKDEADRLETEEAEQQETLKAAAAPDKEKILAYLQALDNVPVPELSTSMGINFINRISSEMADFHEAIIEESETCLN